MEKKNKPIDKAHRPNQDPTNRDFWEGQGRTEKTGKGNYHRNSTVEFLRGGGHKARTMSETRSMPRNNTKIIGHQG